MEETAGQPVRNAAGHVSQLVEKIASQPVKNATSEAVESTARKPGNDNAVSQPVSFMTSKPVENLTSKPLREPMSNIVIDFWVKLFGSFAQLFLSWMLNSNHPFHLSHRWVAAAVRSTEKALFWLPAEPLWRSLQASHVAAAGECPTCSPLGRLSVLHYNQSGSSAEGLDDLDDVSDRQCTSDIDMMMELGPCRVIEAGSQDDQPASADPVQAGCGESPPLLLAVPSEKPGFVVLLVEPTAECDHKDRRQFSAEAVRQLVQDWCGARHSPDDIIVTSGPAVNVSRPGQEDGGIDWVPCLRMLVWPSEEFRSRQRVTDFPPADVREDIYRFGVHLVPTGHLGSPNELIEFRMSFSRAELVTCWHLFPTVRVAVLGLKYVRYIETYRKKMQDIPTTRQLKSYHIKTAAFWLSQDTPKEHWTDPIQAMHMILNKLEEAFTKRTLPCFFWAEVDLLAGISEDDCAAVRRQVMAMRKNILQHLLSWYSIAFDLQWWLENDNVSLLEVSQSLSPKNEQRSTENAHSLSTSLQPSTDSRQLQSSDSQQPSSDSQQPILRRSAAVLRESAAVITLRQSAAVLRQSAVVLRLSAAILRQPAAVLRQSAATLRQSAAVLRQSAAVLRESAAVLRESAVVLRQSAAVLRQSAAVLRQSAAVLRQSAAVLRESAAVLRQSATVLRQSAAVLRQSAAVLRRSAAVLRQSAAVLRQSAVILRQSAAVLRESAAVLRQSAAVLRQSAAILRRSAAVLRESAAVITLRQSAAVLRQSAVVLRLSAAILRQSAAVLRQSAAVLRQSAAVLRQSAAVLRQSAAVLRQSAAVLRQSAAVLRQSAAVLRQSAVIAIPTTAAVL